MIDEFFIVKSAFDQCRIGKRARRFGAVRSADLHVCLQAHIGEDHGDEMLDHRAVDDFVREDLSVFRDEDRRHIHDVLRIFFKAVGRVFTATFRMIEQVGHNTGPGRIHVIPDFGPAQTHGVRFAFERLAVVHPEFDQRHEKIRRTEPAAEVFTVAVVDRDLHGGGAAHHVAAARAGDAKPAVHQFIALLRNDFKIQHFARRLVAFVDELVSIPADDVLDRGPKSLVDVFDLVDGGKGRDADLELCSGLQRHDEAAHLKAEAVAVHHDLFVLGEPLAELEQNFLDPAVTVVGDRCMNRHTCLLCSFFAVHDKMLDFHAERFTDAAFAAAFKVGEQRLFVLCVNVLHIGFLSYSCRLRLRRVIVFKYYILLY